MAMENQSIDESRGQRQRRKHLEPFCCPLCSVTVRPQDLEAHYTMELEKLTKLSVAVHRNRAMNSRNSGKSNGSPPSPTNATDGQASTSTEQSSSWDVFQKIRSNRRVRLRMRRKRRADEPVCPICNESVSESEDINAHVELCIRKSEMGESSSSRNDHCLNNISTMDSDDDDDASVDIVGCGEVYEWAGQTRIRASSLLEGGYAAVKMTNTVNSSQNDDEELNVEDVEPALYGSSQYSEMDVIYPKSAKLTESTQDSLYLRKLVTGSDQDIPKVQRISETAEDSSSNDSCCMPHTSNMGVPSGDAKTVIINALEAKVRELEAKSTPKLKCLICMDEFRVPVVSTCCWHVHCEECWLRTLGEKKLCPQCKMITSPTDLRRIYM